VRAGESRASVPPNVAALYGSIQTVGGLMNAAFYRCFQTVWRRHRPNIKLPAQMKLSSMADIDLLSLVVCECAKTFDSGRVQLGEVVKDMPTTM
jgi:hypothetical protein